jgi:hypothetical protein
MAATGYPRKFDTVCLVMNVFILAAQSLLLKVLFSVHESWGNDWFVPHEYKIGNITPSHTT